MTLHDMKRIDGRSVPDNRQETRAFLTVRNDMIRLASTLSHYRQLGVDRFFVLDGGSTDGTLDFLAAAPDVHAFSAPAGATKADGGAPINALLDAYGVGSWTLTVAAGELFIYPHYEELEIALFCRYLDYVGAQAVACLQLDMYSGDPPRGTIHRDGASLLETCRYFDVGPYQLERTESCPYFEIHGGMRARVYRQGSKAGNRAFGLSGVPLVKWRAGMEFSQDLRRFSPAVIANVLAVLLRFDFLSDFRERILTGSIHDGSLDDFSEQPGDSERLNELGSVSFLCDKSVRFESSTQLVKLGLMRTTNAYEESVRLTTAARAARSA